MNTIIFAVVLLSGYLYVNSAVSSRYKFKRSTGWDAYFYVAVWGVIFTIASWFLCSALSLLGFFRYLYNILLSKEIITQETLNRVFPLSLSDTLKFSDLKFAIFCVVSLLISFAFGQYKKWSINKNEDKKIDALVNAVHNDPFESMLIEASVRSFPVIVTLSSRKIYVGLIICPKFEHGKTEYIQLLPLLSGYRNQDDLTVSITTNYRQHYIDNGIASDIGVGLSISDFRTLVPKEEVEGVSFFDVNTYTKFKAKELSDKEKCTSLDNSFIPKNKE
ncbi:TPA: hypothetical protein ACIC9P_003068 [Morganella morganii]|nr:hypothetical protein [Morganella morganii]